MTPLLGRSGGGGDDPGPRSDEERERARLEREARRAAREGRPAPEPEPEPAAAAVPAPEPEPEPEPVSAPEPAAAAPAAPAAPAWFEPADDTAPQTVSTPTPEVFPPVSEDRMARAEAVAPPAAAMATPVVAPDDPGHDDDHDDHDDHDDVPVGPRSVRPAPKPGVLGASGRSRRRRRPRRGWILGLFVIALIAAIAWFANALYQPFHGTGHGTVVVQIPPNSSSSQIGTILEHDGAVSSGFFFALRARLAGKSSKLRPGSYKLQQDMPYGDAITALTTAPKAAPVVAVTLPEGLSIREAAPRVAAAGLHGSYLDATAHSTALHPKVYGAPKSTRSLEGFLFPDTYQLRRHASVKTLVRDQVAAFRKALGTVDLSYARSKHLSTYDVLKIASMVERESASPGDRKKIAAVIYNRLHDHMPLGIDATLRFALHDWDKPLTVSQLHDDTPYNTRIHLGLPPTPIGSPGLSAIAAAAHPAKVGYLFYVANPDGCGGTVFSSTDAKFERDAARYRNAVANNHGNVPHCKHK